MALTDFLKAFGDFLKMGYPNRFDVYIERYRGILPLNFVKAIIKNESDFDPDCNRNRPGAKGLMQIVKIVRDSFNQRYQTSYTVEDMFSPDINIMIGCDLINRIVSAWKKFHPSLQPDFNDPRYVEILVTGWNAGYSEKNGVGHIVDYMESNGYAPEEITIEKIYQEAKNAPNAWYTFTNDYAPKKMRWAKKVARDFFAFGGNIQA